MLSAEVFRARTRPAGLLRNEVFLPGEEEGEVCHAWLDNRKNWRCLDSGFLLLLYRKERRQRAQGGAATTSPPPAVGLLLESGKLMMARGPLTGSEFLQVDFNKDKLTYKNKNTLKQTQTQNQKLVLSPPLWCRTENT